MLLIQVLSMKINEILLSKTAPASRFSFEWWCVCGASAAVQQRLLFNVRLEDAGPGVEGGFGIDRENYGRNSARITKKNHSDRRNERFGGFKNSD